MKPIVTMLSLCMAFAAAQAQTPPATDAPAGLVKRVLGSVTLERAGALQPAQPGLAVRNGDQLRTGAQSAAAITLADDTLLTAGADSHLVINAFAYDATTQDGNLLLQLWRGTLAVVSGLIAKKTPENMKVQTRTVVLGVRGTEFIIDARGDQ
jgi:hypothetical protein